MEVEVRQCLWGLSKVFGAIFAPYPARANECPPETWEGLGFDGLGPDESIALLEKIFECYLDGHSLINYLHRFGKSPGSTFGA